MRVVLDAPSTAALNMARDEALLDHAEAITLRRTAWRTPAATLGRFQPYAVFELDGAKRDSVRRITGGGTIFHGHDLTVALIAPTPSSCFPDSKPEALAQRAAETLLEALRSFECSLCLRGGQDREREQVAVVDCFERQSPYDIVATDGRKVAGFALHRRRDRVLVQGSVVRQLSERRIEDSEDEAVLNAWAHALGAEQAVVGELTEEELEATDALAKSRYDTAAWNQRK